jgi:pilus assembly protein CpaF
MWTASRSTPPISEEQTYQRLKADTHRVLVETLDPSRMERWSDDRLRTEVESLAGDMARRRGVNLPPPDRERLTEELLHEVFGLGPLQTLADNPHVTEILCNGGEVRGSRPPDAAGAADCLADWPTHRRKQSDG